MKKIVLIFLFAPFILKAQINLDSLKKEIIKAKHDSIRLKIFTQIIKSNLFSNPDVSKMYALKFDSTATILNSEMDLAFGKTYLGMVNYVENDYNTAIKYYLEAIERFEKLKIPLRVGIALNNIGACYQHRKKYLQTIEYYQKALKIFKELNDETWIANVSHNIANEYYKLAAATADKKLANNYFAESEKNEKVALNLFKKNKDSYSEGLAYITFGGIELEKNNFKKSIEYSEKALPLIDANQDPESVGMIYENLGNANYELKDNNKALTYLQKASKIQREIKAMNNLKSTLDILWRVYSQQKDYKKALEAQREYIVLNDSLFNQEKDKVMVEMLEKYESEKKEQENKLLYNKLDQERQRQITYLVGIVGLLLFSITIVYFLYKNRQKSQLIENQNQKLSDLNKEKNTLISMVSHDLSTPFLTIKTWNSILQRNIDKNNLKAIEASEIIHKGAEQGISLIKNILNIEKAETNQHDLKFEKVDLNEIIKEEIASFQEIAKPKNIEIIYSKTNHSIEILSDKHLIIRILENLVSNAIKFSEPNKRVWIDLKDENNKISISIKDEGIGITAEDIPKLFTKYGTTASKTTANENSTGLGLSIVKRILDEIGGQISVKSEKNIGSEFVVILTK